MYDYCREHELEDEPALNDAIAYFVESGGGKWQEVYARPLSYTKKRYYIRTADPLQDVDLPPLPRSRSAPAKVKMLEDLPGLPGLPALTPTEREDQEDDLALIEEADVVRKKPSGSFSAAEKALRLDFCEGRRDTVSFWRCRVVVLFPHN